MSDEDADDELESALEPAVLALVRFRKAYRRVLAVMAREHRTATAEERDEVLDLLETAWAHHRENQEEPEGWRVEDLPEPPAPTDVEIELSLIPAPDWERLSRLEERQPAEPADVRPADTRQPGRVVDVPYLLAEKAVKIHAEKDHGRRRLDQEVPGLGEWSARAVLYWYRVGKPAGLWLDEHERLRWGPAITPIWDRAQREQAIAPTPDQLLLPRP